MRSSSPRPRLRATMAVAGLGLAAASTTLALPATAATGRAPTSLRISSAAGAPLAPGAIKHVWLIILENKSYDATFTGLNKNSYLWQTLPQQGVTLTNYYGTGHSSQDNYEALVGGQAPVEDLQDDCDVRADNLGADSNIDAANDANFGQLASPAGAYAGDGKNGCVYPAGVPTLFNQLDAAGKTWKGYAQDLGDQAGRDDGPCGYPGTATNRPSADLGTTSTAANYSTGSTQTSNASLYPGVQSFTGVQAKGTDSAGRPSAEDGYVGKHFPFPWFHSLDDGTVTTPSQGGTDCDNAHIANLDGPPSTSSGYQGSGLVSDLQSEATTPNFSWITPNNCSDAHDASCKGNNLSGAFTSNGDPDYYNVRPQFDPQNTTPKNFTGGLYASDLFLKWYVPLIERSAAFKDGGLIDITFDEANPAFINSSFNNANDPVNGVGISPKSDYATVDAAGENIAPANTVAGTVDNSTPANMANNTPTEPAGPNTPLTQSTGTRYEPDGTSDMGPVAQPGPGHNSFIRRTPSASRKDTGTYTTGSAVVTDSGVGPLDPGRSVSGTDIPANAFVGPVTTLPAGPLFPTTSGGAVTGTQKSFRLVDAAGNDLKPATSAASGTAGNLTLGAQTSDPTKTNYDPAFVGPDTFTAGGGDTGSVLISPFITPGTTSAAYYNHYSWLRTMEDLFNVTSGKGTASDKTLAAGTVAGGLDGLGHIGFASTQGLSPFGTDVFNNPSGNTAAPSLPPTLPEAGLAVGLPLAGLAAAGWLYRARRRRGTRLTA